PEFERTDPIVRVALRRYRESETIPKQGIHRELPGFDDLALPATRITKLRQLIPVHHPAVLQRRALEEQRGHALGVIRINPDRLCRPCAGRPEFAPRLDSFRC